MTHILVTRKATVSAKVGIIKVGVLCDFNTVIQEIVEGCDIGVIYSFQSILIVEVYNQLSKLSIKEIHATCSIERIPNRCYLDVSLGPFRWHSGVFESM